ncbi:MAG: elongation factor 4 [Candidatus Terrybacteria bacterium]|nr:elongation factor 4 [Candidatus Terrybacteria bacterium]
MDTAHIRNFLITAHIDHGKSTLADRLLELTQTIERRKMHPQYLDRMGLEQERGITIKMQPVRMVWRPNHAESRISNLESRKARAVDGTPGRDSDLEIRDSTYILNLIDTPGHVDFSYEVSRALAAVEGAILLVDATKGVQAQTLANLELARAHGLAIIPAVNKIDLPQARPDAAISEIASLLKIAPDTVAAVSARDGTGVTALLDRVIERVPPPTGNALGELRALVFDSQYDDFRGVVAHVRVRDGEIRQGDKVRFVATGVAAEVLEAGTFRPERAAATALAAGEIGYVITGVKDPAAVRIGDTLIAAASRTRALPGYREPQPVVYAALFPEDADEFEALRDGLSKLRLNDAALTLTPEESHAFGRGFRCGFLGTLHLEIVVERLRREFGLRLIVAHPSVAIRVLSLEGDEHTVRTPREFPRQRKTAFEPWVRLEVLLPPEVLSAALRVIGETRGVVEETQTVTAERLVIRAAVPLLDVVEGFSDRLKSATRGFASFSWQPIGDREGDLVRLDVLVAHETIEAFTQIAPRRFAETAARRIVVRLKETLPAQLFAVAIQVSVDGRIAARETIPALRKDVTAPLYGGDFTRKKKLLVKQRKGKKRLEKTGRVRIPPEVFFALLKKG